LSRETIAGFAALLAVDDEHVTTHPYNESRGLAWFGQAGRWAGVFDATGAAEQVDTRTRRGRRNAARLPG
jgi:hypothetical protein